MIESLYSSGEKITAEEVQQAIRKWGKCMYTVSVSLKAPAQTVDIPTVVQTACGFDSRIRLGNAHAQFNAKSIMGMMSFDFYDGELTISADGSDEEIAAKALLACLTEKKK